MADAYRTALARTIGRLFYNDKEPTKAEKNLMKAGWVEEEKGLWFHAISEDLGDIYASLQKAVKKIKTKEMLERIGGIREEGNSAGIKYPVC